MIDTTQLENGVWVLRLRGEDVNGQVGEDTVTVRIDGGAKVGIVQLSFVDLVTEDFGIPLAAVRTYDSRRAYRSGDFGHGWELDLRAGSVSSNRPVGEYQVINTNPGDFTPCTRIQEQEYHFTEVRISDSEWYLFRPEPVNIQTISGGCAGEIGFEQTDGSAPGATLQPVGETFFRATALPVARFGAWQFESHFISDTTGEPLDVTDFVLTTRDGRRFWINTTDGITDVEDRNGNQLHLRRDAISHSSGRAMQLIRDARGRITEIIGPDGRRTGYSYDPAGNLVSFLDPAERTTRFEYRAAGFPHHLTDIVDWRGVRIAALEYQADGRLGETCDADGVCLRASYDMGARSMVHTDGLGRPTTYAWDRHGNVSHVADGLGNITLYEYANEPFMRGKPITMTDAEGGMTSFGYNWAGDLTSRTEPFLPGEDPEDFTTRWTLDDAGRRIGETLPTGGTTHTERDAQGNERFVRDDANDVIFERTFGPEGQLLTETSRLGTITYEYGPGFDDRPSSRPTRVTDARGAVTDFTYDGQGNVLSAQRGSLRMTHRYDALGRRVFSDFGRGVTAEMIYGDVANEWTRATVSTLGTYTRSFASSGRLVSWTMPNGDTGSREYDALGRVRVERDALGNVTTTAYDDAGRVQSVTDVARAATTTYTRDGVGRTLTETDPLGHVTSRTYDVRGAMLTMTNAVGRTWSYSTTPQESVSTTPLGHTTTSTRTSYGLPGTTTLPGGATTGVSHDGLTQADESSRFPLTRTDESGRVRSFGYDAQSGLSSATDLAGAEWDYAYTGIAASDVQVSVEGGSISLSAMDGEGDVYRLGGGPVSSDDARVPGEELDAWQHGLLSVTSPEGETTSYRYDAGGHRDRITLPNGSIESRTYVNGHLDLQTLAFGTTLDFTRDAAFRVTGRTGSDGSSLAFTYGPEDRIATATDETGTVTHEYDSVGRHTGVVHPTGARVGRGYDAMDQTRHITVRPSAAGTVRDTEYVYDAANRLSEVRDPLGGVTTYAYDDDSRLTGRTLPNGVTTAWTYNARGWVMSVTHRRPDTTVITSVTYERSPSGEPTRITREDGSYVLITYDDALRVESEAYRDSGGGIIDNVEYTYDLDGNRTTRRQGPSIGASTLEEYAYDPGDELRTVSVGGTPTASFEHDDGGRTTRIVRGGHDQAIGWDADDHITSIADGGAETRWQFDAQGRRTRREDMSGGLPDSANRYVVGPTADASLESPHMVTSDSGAAELGYVFAPIPGGAEHPLFRYDPVTGEVVYYLQDSMGSVIGLVDQTATQTARIEYDGFGRERSATGALAGLPVASRGDYRFHGMWLDAGVGLYYVRARVYDAGVGRFLSNDPAEGLRQRPETRELSRFAGGNPVARRDPAGRASLSEHVYAGLVSGVLRGLSLDAIAHGFLAAFRVGTGREELTWQNGLQIAAGVIVAVSLLTPIASAAIAAAARANSGRTVLYHYTTAAGRAGIVGSGEIRASQGAVHARHGAGQYLTDIPPEAVGGATRATAGGLLSLGQLSTRLFRVPWNARRLSDYVAIDVAGLEVIEVAPNIFLIAGESALKVGGRIVRHGVTLP